MDKTKELRKIKEEMEADKDLPLISKPEDIIPGDGNPDSKIVFIGEAGGYHESVQRKPFVGQAGKLLDLMLRTIQLPREEVYITNMVKTRPPENRDPTPEELSAYSRYLDRELEVIQPNVIVTLGRFSMGKFLPGVYISSVHGKIQRVNWKGREVVIFPMYHPAAALRNGNVMFQFKEDFKKLPDLFKQVQNEQITNEQNKTNEAKQMNLI